MSKRLLKKEEVRTGRDGWKKEREEKRRKEREIRDAEKQMREEKKMARRAMFWSEAEPQVRAKKVADLAAAIASLNTAGPPGFEHGTARYLLPHEADQLLERTYTDIDLAEALLEREISRDVIVACFL